MVLVGLLIHLEAHDAPASSATWVDDNRYGFQVKVSAGAAAAAADVETLIDLSATGQARRGQRAADADRALRAGGRARRDRPRSRGRVGGRGPRGSAPEEAVASSDELRVTRELHLLLAPHGLAYLVTADP